MHEEVLIKEMQKIFPQLQEFKDFYLAGGTALALQIGHRISVDLDLFSEKELPDDLLSKVKRVFNNSEISMTYRSKEQLNVLIDNVKTTFLQYKYPVIDSFKINSYVNIASIYEIAAMKAYVVGRRLSYKDYVDLFFLLKEEHVNLENIIKHAKKKFGGDFNDRLFLGQLVSFDDITTQKIDFLHNDVGRNDIEDLLKKMVHDFKL